MLVLDVDSNNPLVQVKEQVTKKIVNIEQWSDAFLVYIAIYTEQYPPEVPGILKYMQIFRTIASNSRTSVFLSYDRDVRKLRAHDSMPWSTIGPGFHKGFRIPFKGDLVFKAVPCNHPSLLENIYVATEMIHVEQNMGRIAGPFVTPPFPNLVISPLGLIPKSEPSLG